MRQKQRGRQGHGAREHKDGPPFSIKSSPARVVKLNGVLVQVNVERVHCEGVRCSHKAESHRPGKIGQSFRNLGQERCCKGDVEIAVGEPLKNVLPPVLCSGFGRNSLEEINNVPYDPVGSRGSC